MRLTSLMVLRGLAAVILVAALMGLAGCGGAGTSASGDFGLGVSPASASVTAGSTAQVSVTAAATNGFQGPVAVTVGGLPAGVVVSPASLTVTPGTAAAMTLTAANAATVGSATVTLTGSSGALAHTTTMALTVVAAPAPPPDFALTLTPASQTVMVGGAAVPVSLMAAGLNGFAGAVAVVVSGLPTVVTAAPGTLSLAAGVAQTVNLTAGAGAMAGTATVTFTGSSGALSHAATVALTVAPAAVVVPAAAPDVTTYHFDNTRAGWNAQEIALTTANVNSSAFGLKGVYALDGKVDAQPLYAGGLAMVPGTTNVLYAVTEHDSVYALNAATGAQLWKTSVLGSGETTSDAHNCNQILPEIGITSTPVIDRSYGAHGAIFVVAMSKDGKGAYHQRLHALDLVSGAEMMGSPTEITATYPGTGANSKNGTVVFDPAQYAERVGLLLLRGTIYMGWTSHCDAGAYTGWVMGYSESTLQQTTVLNLTPNGSEGSVWMSGYGLGADAAGSIYLLDANGTLDSGFTAAGFPNKGDYGNAVLKLGTAGGLSVLDYFEPYNTVSESAADVDLGSGGAMLLPDLTDGSGTARHLLVGAGKDGFLYVTDRDNMGKINLSSANNSNAYQALAGALPQGAWSGPAYFNNTVYYAGVGDFLKAFTITNAKLSTSPTSRSTTAFGYPGATPSVSSNGTANGIVWAVESGTGAAAVLHAYDATNLAKELYNSKQAANGRDGFGTGNKFITPMVTNGTVYVGTPTGVAAFGLLGQ